LFEIAAFSFAKLFPCQFDLTFESVKVQFRKSQFFEPIFFCLFQCFVFLFIEGTSFGYQTLNSSESETRANKRSKSTKTKKEKKLFKQRFLD
jgi:hypothetical protein